MIPGDERPRASRAQHLGPHRRVEWRRVEGAPDPERLHAALALDPRASFWLDSSDAGAVTATDGRISIMGDASGPLAEVLRYDVTTARWDVRTAAGRHTVRAAFHDHLRSLLASCPVAVPEDLPVDFALGWVGALGYQLKDEGTRTPTHRSPHPDAALILADRAVVLDHASATVLLLALVDDALPHTASAAAEWFTRTSATIKATPPATAEPPEPPPPGLVRAPEDTPPRFHLDQDEASYIASIERCLEHIRAGDSYEICLTNMATGAPLADPAAAYRALRRTSPVPYGALLRFDDLAILSASPERFLRVTGDGTVQTRPIKGTRPRGSTKAEDARLRQDLATHPKDLAENLMIVDLLRNDLSRVCVPGTVRTDDLFRVETFSHVHQLVSTVSGTLRAGRTAVDALEAAFPGGSMTGAPKIRTTEISDSLEHRARGFYSGAIGWISFTGTADLAITIRTLVSDASATTFGVGGAIVADSDPGAEVEETRVKARALLAALGAELV